MKILYHGNCNDGAGAAFAAWLKLGEETSTGEPIDYIPVQYGSEPPDVDNQEVFILDFSYPRDIICQMAETANRITIIDHHKTAESDLSKPFPGVYGQVPLCDVRTIFDMNKSGAVLAWEYFNKEESMPEVLLRIQDRDLWKHFYTDTQDVAKGLQLYRDFRDWGQFIDDHNWIAAKGAAINQYMDVQSEIIVKNKPIIWPITRDIVPVYNLPGFMLSDTLHKALEKYPDAPYAVGYFDLPDKRIYSLRSRQGSTVDVGEIAKHHGGGGHKHASGFAVVHPSASH